MRLLGRILARTFAAIAGYLLASLAAGVAVVVAVTGTGPFLAGEPAGDSVAKLLYVGGVAGAFIAVLAAGPAAVAILVAEVFAVRAALYYTLAGGLTGALGYVTFTDLGVRVTAPPGTPGELAVMVAAGFAGGFVYWLITGRNAGVARDLVSAGSPETGDTPDRP